MEPFECKKLGWNTFHIYCYETCPIGTYAKN